MVVHGQGGYPQGGFPQGGYPLTIRAGRNVRAHIAREGFRLADFPTLLGAAGGPKWLILYGLDRVLAPRLLQSVRDSDAPIRRPLDLIGASIGAWRFAAWLHEDPVAALDRLFERYTDEALFDPALRSPSLQDFDALFRDYLAALFGANGVDEVLGSELARLHMVVALFPESRIPLNLRLGLAALRNLLGREALLASSPQRLLCSTGPLPALIAERWPHAALRLDAQTLVPALMATAAVPGLIRPVPGLDPSGGKGLGIDGGILDYHFDGTQNGAGFVLYPHFVPTLTAGWFDKPFRRRRVPAERIDDLLLISPSPEFVAALPGGRIPDRGDPRRLGPAACQRAWRAAGEASLQLGDALGELLDRDALPALLHAAGD